MQRTLAYISLMCAVYASRSPVLNRGAEEAHRVSAHRSVAVAPRSDQQLLDLVADARDLRRQLRRLVGQDAAAHHRTRHAAGAAQSDLRRHEHVRHVLRWKEKQLKNM